jgi:hypothetical protein
MSLEFPPPSPCTGMDIVVAEVRTNCIFFFNVNTEIIKCRQKSLIFVVCVEFC